MTDRENPAITKAMENFALQTSYIVGLQQNGKYEELEAYAKIKALWKSLKKRKKALKQKSKS